MNTKIPDAERNRTDRYRNESERTLTSAQQMMAEAGRQALAAGLAPSDVAAQVLHAIQNEKFYILTHPEFTRDVETRVRHILDGKNPAKPAMA